MTNLPDHPVRDGRVLDVSLHLLDRAVLDRNGRPVLAVDDVAVRWDGDGPPVVTDLVLGSGLRQRFFGAHQPWRTRLTVSWRAVTAVGDAIHLSSDRDDLDATWTERWLCDRLISRIPGSHHASG